MIISNIFIFKKKAKIPDRYLQRKLNELVVKCHIENEGTSCEWSGPMEEFRVHYNSHFKP
jgi:hypothetical protein